MIETPERLKLDSLALGEARVKVLKTIDGEYSLHGQTGWDDLPYWEYHDAWIIETQAHGKLKWGPWKYRENSKKEHSGVAELQFLEPRLFDSESKAEDYALKRAAELEAKGFRVEIELGNVGRTDLRDVREWINGQPPKSFGQYRPPLEMLEAQLN